MCAFRLRRMFHQTDIFGLNGNAVAELTIAIESRLDALPADSLSGGQPAERLIFMAESDTPLG